MSDYIIEWLGLLGRWLHVITGIAWIGASFYFVWLDNHLLPPKRQDLKDVGVGGELWALHGGGFYNAMKYKVAPPELPETLHWFYWEAYSTWMSGFFLLCLIYYRQASLYFIDPAVMALTPPEAVLGGLGFLLAGWLVYDGLCRSPLGRHERALGTVVALLLALDAWALCHVFSGRGAYIEFGATLGSIMVANVCFVIMPGQRALVRARQEGRVPDPAYGQRGKQRSVHNTYFTLPVLFAMISNHYAMTYGASSNWLALIGMSLAGAGIRAWFVARHKAHERGGKTSVLPLAAGLAALAATALLLVPKPPLAVATVAPLPALEFQQVQYIVQQRCAPCHATSPTMAGFTAPPLGVLLDSPEHILAHSTDMGRQIGTGVMPLGNLTRMTDAERATVMSWIQHGSPH